MDTFGNLYKSDLITKSIAFALEYFNMVIQNENEQVPLKFNDYPQINRNEI